MSKPSWKKYAAGRSARQPDWRKNGGGGGGDKLKPDKFGNSYTKEFAATTYLAFSGGPNREAIIDYSITREQWLKDPRGELSITGYRYTQKEREVGWGTILAQRSYVQWRYEISLFGAPKAWTMKQDRDAIIRKSLE